MKAAPFAYARVADVAEAVGLLADDPEAKVIAGGQSLVPMLAMRLARPSTLVDINHVDPLARLDADGAGLRIGAVVRQRDLERAPETASVPLLTAALPHIGHRELRNRGTVCGSLAHADPAAELPAVAVTLGATLAVAGPAGRRDIAARDFFAGPLQTTLADGELLTAVRFPAARPGDGFAFAEVARRHGDFALCGVAAAVHVGSGAIESATVGLFGVADTPLAVDVSEPAAAAGDDQDLLRRLGEDVAAGLSPTGDLHGGGPYRQRLAAAIVARCLARATADATAEEGR